MKRGAVTASVDAPDVDAAIAVLRNRGLRASTARRQVLETLYRADRLRAVTRRRLGHEPRFTRFPMAGICTACADRRRDDRPRR